MLEAARTALSDRLVICVIGALPRARSGFAVGGHHPLVDAQWPRPGRAAAQVTKAERHGNAAGPVAGPTGRRGWRAGRGQVLMERESPATFAPLAGSPPTPPTGAPDYTPFCVGPLMPRGVALGRHVLRQVVPLPFSPQDGRSLPVRAGRPCSADFRTVQPVGRHPPVGLGAHEPAGQRGTAARSTAGRCGPTAAAHGLEDRLRVFLAGNRRRTPFALAQIKLRFVALRVKNAQTSPR